VNSAILRNIDYGQTKIRSTKSEIRNNAKIQIFKCSKLQGDSYILMKFSVFKNFDFWFSNLFRVSLFEFRIFLRWPVIDG